MSLVYFPSCKFRAAFPPAAQKTEDYLRVRFGARISGCCRSCRELLGEGDTAMCVCGTCRAICAESSQVGEVLTVWELLDRDESFPFPEHSGEAVTLQDCWRARSQPGVHRAVRSLLRKMGYAVAEAPASRGKSLFCGVSLLSPPSGENAGLAPRCLGGDAQGAFRPCPPGEQRDAMARYCRSLPSERPVVAYCVSCVKGLRLGGADAIHLMELLTERL